MKYLIALCILACTIGASKLDRPPVIKDASPELQLFLDNVYRYHNNHEILDTNPNGSRNGNRGDVVIYASGSVYYWGVCISNPNGTDWRTVSP